MLNSNCWSTRANCGGILINYVKKHIAVATPTRKIKEEKEKEGQIDCVILANVKHLHVTCIIKAFTAQFVYGYCSYCIRDTP